MRHKLYLFLAVVFVPGLSFYAFSHPITSDCRNPEACYDCHHLTDIPDVIPDVDTQCKTCHTDPADVKKYDLGCERGGWSLTGPMDYARFIHAGSFLNDGRFLVTGGGTPPYFFPVNNAEILDPATRLFVMSGGTMSDPRWSHTQTTLADGKVLVAGGRNFQSPAIPGAIVLDSVDIYDDEMDTFTTTGNMNVPRRSHKAILLDDGRVLITGGGDSVSTAATMPLDTAEIYDPATGTFRLLTATMTVPRQYHSMIKLTDGKVLVIGGALGPGLSNITTSVDMFDPVTETFIEIGLMNFPRITQVATLLRDGKVLLAFSWDGIDVANDSEIYDPATNTFTATLAKPIHGKVDLHGIRMLDGTVVCPTGGNEHLDALSETTIYRPETDDFVLTGSVQFPRTAAVPGLLKDGRPLLVGGFGEGVFYAIASIYTPSILSQAKGFKNVLSDLSDEAYLGGSGVKESMLVLADTVINLMGDCRLCHMENVKEKTIEKAYKTAQRNVATKIIPKMDGCAGGDPKGDLILGCDNQEQPYAVATLMLKTLDVILGDALSPEATAEVDLPTGEYPHTVQFTGTATDPDGTVALFFWEFGDAAISSDQNPMHIYNCPGDYTATLTVVDNDGLVGQASVDVHVDYTPGISASFGCDLLPSYKAFCAGCHQGAEAAADLDLTSYAGVMAGSVNGPVVIQGDPENSPIVQKTGPPTNHAKDVGGEPLSPETMDKQWTWILEDAMDN